MGYRTNRPLQQVPKDHACPPVTGYEVGIERLEVTKDLIGRRWRPPLLRSGRELGKPRSHDLQIALPGGQPLHERIHALTPPLDRQTEVGDARGELRLLRLQGPLRRGNVTAAGMQFEHAGHQCLAALRQRHHLPPDRSEHRCVGVFADTRGAVPAFVVPCPRAAIASLVPALGVHRAPTDAAHEDRGEQPAGVPRPASERMVGTLGHAQPCPASVDRGIGLIPNMVAHDPEMGHLPGEHLVRRISDPSRAAGRQLLLVDLRTLRTPPSSNVRIGQQTSHPVVFAHLDP